MLIKYLYSVTILTLSLLLCLIQTELLVDSVLLEWNPSPTLGFMPLIILFDKLSITMLLTVAVVTTNVVLYSQVYMGVSAKLSSFRAILFLFVSFMCALCTSANLYTAMVSWDGLGLTSFCLIIYFSSWQSFYSGMVTFLCNRLGDLFLLTSIVVMLSTSGTISWTASFTSLSLSMCLCVGAISKSAMFPFSSWLPLAMAAPTPVSSLVHSSTLVTAGVYLLIRFQHLLPHPTSYLTYLSILTALISGTLALIDLDMKKVIAYSTLSHLSLMVLFLSLNCPSSALFHLVTHAMFKSHLFMLYGSVIWTQSDNQDLRVVWSNPSVQPLMWVMLLGSTLAMVGTPFLCGYYSKEMMCLVSLTYSSKLFLTYPLLLLIAVTSAYSIRLIIMLVRVPVNPTCYAMSYSEHQMLSLLTLNYITSVGVGSVLWLSFISFYEEPTLTSVEGKTCALISILVGTSVSAMKHTIKRPFHLFMVLSRETGLILADLLSWMSESALKAHYISVTVQVDTHFTKLINHFKSYQPDFNLILNSLSLLPLKVVVACLTLMLLL